MVYGNPPPPPPPQVLQHFKHASQSADSAYLFYHHVHHKKGTLSQHFVTHVVPPFSLVPRRSLLRNGKRAPGNEANLHSEKSISLVANLSKPTPIQSIFAPRSHTHLWVWVWPCKSQALLFNYKSKVRVPVVEAII